MNQLLGKWWYIELYFLATPSSNINVDYLSFIDHCIRMFHNNIEREMIILLSIIQTLKDYYCIFGYYIFGCDRPTENVITENVISPIIIKSCIVLKGGSNRGGRKWGKYCYFVVYCNIVYFVRNILCSDSNSNSQVEKFNPMHFLIARQLDQLSLN